MEYVTDDVLMEILARVNDAKSAIQSSLVCKRWHALILNHKNHSYFKKRFSQTHPKLSQIVFNCNTTQKPFHRLTLAPNSHQQNQLSEVDLDDLVVRATCGDLILLSRGFGRYLVYNCLTNKSVALPEIPPNNEFNSFFSYEKGTIPGNFGFVLGGGKVVIVYFTLFWHESMFTIFTVEFDLRSTASSSREWRFSKVRCPFAHTKSGFGLMTRLEIVRIEESGVLYWLEGMAGNFMGIVEFDSSALESRFVALPPRRFKLVKTHLRCYKNIYRLGVVRGRVRLSQLLRETDDKFELLIWELDGSSSSWTLVHEVSLEAPPDNGLVFLLAFDPTDSDVVFLVRDREIFRFGVRKHEYRRVCSFPSVKNKSEEESDELIVARCLTVFTVDLPSWPTPPISLLSP